MICFRKKVNGSFITISDDPDLLNEKMNGGEPVLLLLTENNKCLDTTFLRYAVELEKCTDSEEEIVSQISEDYLKLIISRFQNVPLVISESDRIVIRELVFEDINDLKKLLFDIDVDFRKSIFDDEQTLNDSLISYIKNIYDFYNFGIWGVFDKEEYNLIGIVGYTPKDRTELENVKKLNLNKIYLLYNPALIYKDMSLNETYIDQKNDTNDLNQETPLSVIKILSEDKESNHEIVDSDNHEISDYYILELGYAIFEKYRNKGYATEACKLAIRYAIENIDFSLIYTKISNENIASIHVSKKLGFNRLY